MWESASLALFPILIFLKPVLNFQLSPCPAPVLMTAVYLTLGVLGSTSRFFHRSFEPPRLPWILPLNLSPVSLFFDSFFCLFVCLLLFCFLRQGLTL